jgi:molybdopterin molybdotransferase
MGESRSVGALPGYAAALGEALAAVMPLGTEQVALGAARGRVLRQDIAADRDQPPFDRAAMDGFAVRSGDVRPGAILTITGTLPAGAPPEACRTPLAAGAAVRIATGAPLPPNADAVVPIEQSALEGVAGPQSGGGSGSVRFAIDSITPWRSVHRRGSDAARSQVVLRTGTVLGPAEIGIAAAVGAVQLTVARQPRITLLTTGDEVRPPETPAEKLQPQQIRNSNGPMLESFFAALGVPVWRCEHMPDDPERTLAAAREALSHSNLVVTVGGVSVGERDFLPWSWGKLGLTTILRGAAIQPGRPVFLAGETAGGKESDSFLPGPASGPSDAANETGGRDARPTRGVGEPAERRCEKLVLGLPGNPVSVLATAHLFAWPILRRMRAENADSADAAAHPFGLPWRSVPLAEEAAGSAARQVFRAARLDAAGHVHIIPWHGSGDLMHTAAADGWVALPLNDGLVAAGTPVPFLPMVGR